MAAENAIAPGWPAEAHTFAEAFARFEAALKAIGMIQHGKSRAEASWKTLAAELKEEFFAYVRESGRAATLIGEPPRTQTRGLEWKPEKPQAIASVEDLLVKGVCQVRNNLLHGGKFMGSAADRDRSAALIAEATWILGEIAKRRPDFRV